MEQGTTRNTKQKRAVYAALCALGHPSATEVYDYVKTRDPKISRGTVFRVLRAFSEGGRAVKIHIAGSDDRFDATLFPHCHAYCRVCGKVKDVFSPALSEALEKACAEDFTAETVEADFIGVCGDCRSREN